MTTKDAPLYGDMTLPEWDRKWEPVPNWQKDYQDDLKYRVGLYRFIQNGRIILIGVGTAEHGALAKRLSDYRRPSPSGRRCRSGEYIYDNRHLLTVEVIVIGAVGDKGAVRLSKQLKEQMIERHKPTEQGSYRPSWARKQTHSIQKQSGAAMSTASAVCRSPAIKLPLRPPQVAMTAGRQGL